MALKNNEYITMVDIMSAAGSTMKKVIDLTAQQNPMLTDAPAIECNLGAKHRTYINKGLAKFVWGKAYQGVPTSKGRMEAIEHTTGYAESAIEAAVRTIDEIENHVQYAGLTGAARTNAIGMAKTNQFNMQQKTHANTLTIGMAQALLYEDEKRNPNRITGFFPFFNSTTGRTRTQLIRGTGTKNNSDCTSMLMVTWHPETCHLIYPRAAKSHGGLKVGPLMKIHREDKDPNSDGFGGTYFVYRKEMEWHTGLAVNDFRYVVRIGGIRTSTLSKAKDIVTSGNPIPNGDDLVDLLSDAYYQHEGRRATVGKTCIYGNVTPIKFLDFQARNGQKNQYLFLENTGMNAKEVLTFRGIPIKESDAFTNHENGFR